jgi:hypothetical protein
MQKHTPYDTGKVKIGLIYTPPPPQTTPESDWIQGILLGDRQGMSEEALACVQSLVFIATIIIGIILLEGFTNA